MKFSEFWPIYLSLHQHKLTKIVHAAGLVTAYFFASCALISSQHWFLITIPMAAYGPAFCCHFFIEHNHPASFKHPLLSIAADHKLMHLVLTGRI